MPMSRAAYLAALRAERGAIASRREPDQIRLAAIDAELGQYDDQPTVPVIEAAVPGPFAQSRAKARKAAAAAPVKPEPGP